MSQPQDIPPRGSPRDNPVGSYEEQWLLGNSKQARRTSVAETDDKNRTSQSTATSTGKKGPKQPKPQTGPPNGVPPPKAAQGMTKAERRAIQERQRMEKEARVAAGLPGSAKKAAEQLSNPGASPRPASLASPNPSITSSPSLTKPAVEQVSKKAKAKTVEGVSPWLMHLEIPRKPETSSAGSKGLHPAMVTFGLWISEYKILGSNLRCAAMLETFKQACLSNSFLQSLTVIAQIIKDHRPPEAESFARHIQKHLDPHIAYLLNIRPMSLSMRECIRWIKKEISDIVETNPTLEDEGVRHRLIERIDHFIRDRITLADQLIVKNGLEKIQDGDVVLTYAKSTVVQKLLLEAKANGKQFRVIVVDSRPRLEGKTLLARLVKAGIDCTYVMISALSFVMRDVSKVILGAHALLSNGAMYSRVGTSLVAMSAKDLHIPVIVCCETFKFVNRTQVDSLVLNETADPDELVSTPLGDKNTLVNWKQESNLGVLNLLYDVTPSEYITVVVTEVGLIPCTSAPVIWREYNEELRKRQK
ncbi:hypothetical protein BZG36_00649 [Bifiguratus adelaidae]|uniref:Translation initiation factor eIF2B subunit delta n=1 Tax=Bifiguratus adelaidae TaxID=1938954 RepID=A0A261Y716_9FUNG|nr:hypothetical protein BZG36_00649 [Bifiguratus adelaidae]